MIMKTNEAPSARHDRRRHAYQRRRRRRWRGSGWRDAVMIGVEQLVQLVLLLLLDAAKAIERRYVGSIMRCEWSCIVCAARHG